MKPGRSAQFPDSEAKEHHHCHQKSDSSVKNGSRTPVAAAKGCPKPANGAARTFRTLVESMNEGAAILAPDGTLIYGNRHLSTLLEVPREALIGTALCDFVATSGAGSLCNLSEGKGDYCNKEEVELRTATGKILTAYISCCAIEVEGRRHAGVVVTDISKRKQLEDNILRLNRLYAVSSAINHAIVHTNDRASLFVGFCRIAVALGGFRLAWVGLVNRSDGLVEVVASQGETGYLEGIRISTRDEPEGLGPTGKAIRDGSYCICNNFLDSAITTPWQQRARLYGLNSSASIALRQKGEVIGALTLYSGETDFFDSRQIELFLQMGGDISFALDRLESEARRRKVELALQEESAERLRTMETLRQKEQMLIHQSRLAAMGEMISNIAHQWRQPLNVLGLTIQQLPLYFDLGELDKEFLEQNVRKAMQLIHHMSLTIDDFRNYFKPDKEKVRFEVQDEVQRTLQLIEGGFTHQNISVKVEVHDRPVLYGYPNEFSQVLLNILMNARDVLIERKVAGPWVEIAISSNGGHAVVEIADNGGGIPEEILGCIFEPYFTTKGPQVGTGVGLFMSKNIIERNMDGRLIAYNTGEGAKFRIEV